MAELKIHILFPFRDGPWGGCNQFLKALRDQLRGSGHWADAPDQADVVLFDSFNGATEVLAWKRRLPHVPFVQRIDGPVSLYRGKDRHVDELIHAFGATVADGIVFQSRYSQKANLALGMPQPARSAVILNAPSGQHFYRGPHTDGGDGRIRLIASSWSPNWNKGFEVYQHLDRHLDFSRYRMTFVGNSPVTFKNILQIPAQDATGLSALLRSHDIYVMASRNECCSNALAEALACGLPSVTLDSGGNAEVMGQGGALFTQLDEVLPAIARVAEGLDRFRISLPTRTMAEVADDYRAFLSEVKATARPPHRLSVLQVSRLIALMAASRLRGKLGQVMTRLPKRPAAGTDKQAEPLAKTVAREGYRAACGALTVANLAAPRHPELTVHYGGARIGDVGGPLVKVKRLNEHFPDQRWGYNLVYLLSNTPYLPELALRLLKARSIPIVYNQNGVFYPAWYAGDWQAQNRRMAMGYHAADWVFYQSDFCRRAADKFLGARTGPGEILYNAVDTTRFRPAEKRHDGPFTFLITGKIGDHLAYRLESTIEGLAKARAQGFDARLRIAGFVAPGARAGAERLAQRLAVGEQLAFSGPYRQEDARTVYTAADAYVMTKHNDPCPNTVLEALACGLPVLYSNSGGVPELVGTEAGIGLDCGGENWERPQVPSAEDIGAGMLAIAAERDRFATEARRRAVERFDMIHWIDRHRAVFTSLLENRA